jgi:hypothetical protein
MVAQSADVRAESIGDAVDGRHEGRAVALVAEACLAAERHSWADGESAARLEWLRAELVSISFCCGDDAASQTLLAVEQIDGVLAVDHRTALAS